MWIQVPDTTHTTNLQKPLCEDKSTLNNTNPDSLCWHHTAAHWTHPLHVALDHLWVSSLVTCHADICFQAMTCTPQLAFLWTTGTKMEQKQKKTFSSTSFTCNLPPVQFCSHEPDNIKCTSITSTQALQHRFVSCLLLEQLEHPLTLQSKWALTPTILVDTLIFISAGWPRTITAET